MNRLSRLVLVTVFSLAALGARASAQAATTAFRFRTATEAELKAISLRTGGALVVEAVPTTVSEIETGDVLAFADTIALLSLDDLLGAVTAAAGKTVDLLFYRAGKAGLASVVLTPEMLTPSPLKPVEPTEPTAETTAPAATKFIPEQWTFQPAKASGAILAEGGMRLRLGKGKSEGDAHTATRREKLRGDFELVVHYEMVDWQPATMMSSGFGIRLESAAGWSGQRMVTFDRRGSRRSDRVVAGTAEQQDDELAVQPTGNRGFLRVRRAGDTWRFATRDADSRDDAWTELGELTAKLSPDIELWLTAHSVGSGETRVLVRDVAIGRLAVQR